MTPDANPIIVIQNRQSVVADLYPVLRPSSQTGLVAGTYFAREKLG